MSVDPKKYPAKKGTPSILETELAWVSPFNPDGSRKDAQEKTHSSVIAPQVGRRNPSQARARKEAAKDPTVYPVAVGGLSPAEEELVPQSVQSIAINRRTGAPSTTPEELLSNGPYVPPFQHLNIINGEKGLLIDMETLMADVHGEMAEDYMLSVETQETAEGSVTVVTHEEPNMKLTQKQMAERHAAEQQNQSINAIERDFFKSTRKDPEPMTTPTIKNPPDFEADLAEGLKGIIVDHMLADLKAKKPADPEHDKQVEALIEGDLKAVMVNNIDAKKLDYTGPVELNPRAAELVGKAEAGATPMEKHASSISDMASQYARRTSDVGQKEEQGRALPLSHFETYAHRNLLTRSIDLSIMTGAPNDQRYAAQPLTFQKIEPGSIVGPAFSLPFAAAEALMNELWCAGVRPSSTHLKSVDFRVAPPAPAADTAALSAHLEDMRAIVAKQFDLTLKPR